jgi:cell wall-associated NlpC family hydrolase
MRRSTAIVLCCACAAALLALAPAPASAAHKRRARPSHHAAALHARRARSRVVVRAWRAVGTPYRRGGSSLRGGFDCSGLTRWVSGRLGISLPHYSGAQWRYGRRVSRRALRPGDLLFFSRLGHVGIYLGHGAVIHAPRPAARVRFERLRGWLGASFYGARRFGVLG